MTVERIGFIGLGDMGFPMARRLLKSGHTVISCANRRREPIETLKKEGLIEEKDPRSVGAQSDILMTIVVGDGQTDAILHGPTGAMAGMRPGSLIILMSTLLPTYCQAIAVEAAEKGVDVIDCPVSGGSIGAEKGTLALIAGGKSEQLARATGALNVLGTVHHCGEIGMGQVAKLANNTVCHISNAAVQEARELARSYGMDLDRLMEVISKSTGKCFVADNWEFVMTNWSHLSVLARKDMELGLEAAKATGTTMKIAETCCCDDLDKKRV